MAGLIAEESYSVGFSFSVFPVHMSGSIGIDKSSGEVLYLPIFDCGRSGEMADAVDSKSTGAQPRAGSSPAFGRFSQFFLAKPLEFQGFSHFMGLRTMPFFPSVAQIVAHGRAKWGFNTSITGTANSTSA